MGHWSFSIHRLQQSIGNILEEFETSHRPRQFLSWFILLSGLVIWITVQGYFVLEPLWTRALPPEVDDSLACLVRTQVMEECFWQDCPALQDLRKQLYVASSDPDIARQRQIAGFPFPFYHPLFSLILLVIKKWTPDLITAYKIAWSVSPVFFGAAFACLLASIWGKPAAGVALGLLAFKVFPGTGLQYLTSSNLAMATCVLMWARIISRRGDTPWLLVTGSIVLIAMHPIGWVYALMSALLALLISGSGRRLRIWVAILSAFFLIVLTFVIASVIKQLPVFNPLDYADNFPGIIQTAKTYLSNATEVLVHSVRLKAGLFGSFSLFFLVVTFGFFAATGNRRKIFLKAISIYALFLPIILCHTHPLTPKADLFLRVWIPLLVILFGAVGNAAWYTLRQSLSLLKKRLQGQQGPGDFSLPHVWPAFVLALVLGYSFDMVLSGSEQIYATQDYMRNRQSLSFDSAQPELLLSQAEPGDRVLYTSTMIMSYYFIHGAMKLGAVYYHSDLRREDLKSDWLKEPGLHFAAVYNPIVYHPSLEGLDEKDRCITGPEFHFSPTSKPRKYGPISREGFIPACDFKWIQVDIKEGDSPKHLKILIRNPGKPSWINVVPVKDNGIPIWQINVRDISAKWTGWVEVDLDQATHARRFRIILPKGRPQFLIGGIAFGDDKNHWPWAQKAILTLLANAPDTGKIKLAFNPNLNLPSPLNERKISVLDDHGSSVLFRIE